MGQALKLRFDDQHFFSTSVVEEQIYLVTKDFRQARVVDRTYGDIGKYVVRQEHWREIPFPQPEEIWTLWTDDRPFRVLRVKRDQLDRLRVQAQGLGSQHRLWYEWHIFAQNFIPPCKGTHVWARLLREDPDDE